MHQAQIAYCILHLFPWYILSWNVCCSQNTPEWGGVTSLVSIGTLTIENLPYWKVAASLAKRWLFLQTICPQLLLNGPLTWRRCQYKLPQLSTDTCISKMTCQITGFYESSYCLTSAVTMCLLHRFATLDTFVSFRILRVLAGKVLTLSCV